MELAYLPDSMPRYSVWPVYSTWEENNYQHYVSKKQTYRCVRETKTDEKNCSICQQKKKRFLSNYIKHKQTHVSRIQEEDEETEEDTSSSSTAAKNHTGK